ncbi:MAG: hypothetical protein HGB14_04060, partial [Anaerolineaceae bacterium]|nr:hypothetical protein [Anaerolineaceae bacterium]
MKDVIPEKSSFPLLVWDCDPGCDDALGIALFLKRQLASPSYDNVYFLTVAGNVSIEQTTFNAARVLIACLWQKEQSEQDTKKLAQQFMIYRGCNRSMDGEEPSAASVHGRDGLGDAPNSLIWEGKECDSGERPAEEIAKDLIGSLIQKNCSAVE